MTDVVQRDQRAHPRVAGVILAAGTSTRFGSPKQLARVGGRTMLEAVVERARNGGLAPVLVVVPPGVAVPPHAVSVVNDEPQAGMSRSLRLGIGAVPAEASAAMILLGDQPTMPVATIEAVLEVVRGDRPVIVARAEGRIGPPVVLRREAFDMVASATGDEGLRSILAAHPELVTNVDVPEHPPDVDTPQDLARLLGG